MSKFNVNKRDIYERLYSKHPLEVFFDDPKSQYEHDNDYRNEHVGFSDYDYEKRSRMGASFKKYYFDETPYKYPIRPTSAEFKKDKENRKNNV